MEKKYVKDGAHNRYAAYCCEDVDEQLGEIDKKIKALEETGGATFTPSVSSAGVLSWTNDKGLENPDPVNIKGKSAYEHAKAGGYTGTESIFNLKLSDAVEYTAEDLRSDLAVGIHHVEKAVSDRYGNIIDQNYATKKELASYAPDYVATEAAAVIDRVIAAQGNRTFTFAALTDLHYGNGNYTDGILHACQALKYIDERVKLDAVVVLGDYTDGYPETGIDNALGDFKEVNRLLNSLRFAPNLRQQGNHDYYADNIPVTHRFIQAYSDDVAWGDKLGGYYHKDFEEFKLRVISLNTVEKENTNLSCSVAQYEWFINSLDLSEKEDASEWQILIISHHPLDWYDVDGVYSFAQIIDAYKSGTSWSDTTLGISCDYTDKNAATLICNIHGHIHNLLVDYIHFGNVVNGNKSTVWRMATPEACINRANQYEGEWAEETTYNKTTESAEDTAFCIYCVDLDTKTIKSICYGAGYDRTLNYATGESSGGDSGNTETPDEPETIVNLLDTVGYTDGMRFSASNGAEKSETGCVATGYIDITNLDYESTGDAFYAWGADFNNANNSGKCVIVAYDENKNVIGQTYINHDNNLDSLKCYFDDNGVMSIVRNGNPTCKYIRFSGVGTGENVVVTWNQLPS